MVERYRHVLFGHQVGGVLESGTGDLLDLLGGAAVVPADLATAPIRKCQSR